MRDRGTRFVSVEAGIGVGKSTMLPLLVDELNRDSAKPWKQVQEPVDDPMFAELLDKFYKEPTTENRVRFQFYVTDARFDLVNSLPTDYNYVIERSLLSDVVFCQLNFLEMECPEGHYMGYFYYISKRLKDYPQISDAVYLTCDPQVALARIQSRGRECEKSITLDYVKDLHRFHDSCLPQACRVQGTTLREYDWTNFGSVNQIARDFMGVK